MGQDCSIPVRQRLTSDEQRIRTFDGVHGQLLRIHDQVILRFSEETGSVAGGFQSHQHVAHSTTTDGSSASNCTEVKGLIKFADEQLHEKEMCIQVWDCNKMEIRNAVDPRRSVLWMTFKGR